MSYLEALQTTLAGEHAAVYVLGYLGAQASRSTQERLSTALDDAYVAHLTRRDELVRRIRAGGGSPVAAAAAYRLPVLGGSGDVAPAALALERAAAVTYDFLVSSSPSAQRRWAVGLLVDAAVRELDLGGEPEAFPGRSAR